MSLCVGLIHWHPGKAIHYLWGIYKFRTLLFNYAEAVLNLPCVCIYKLKNPMKVGETTFRHVQIDIQRSIKYVSTISKQRSIIYVSSGNKGTYIIYVCVVYYHSTVPKVSYTGFINGLETHTIKTCQNWVVLIKLCWFTLNRMRCL